MPRLCRTLGSYGSVPQMLPLVALQTEVLDCTCLWVTFVHLVQKRHNRTRISAAVVWWLCYFCCQWFRTSSLYVACLWKRVFSPQQGISKHCGVTFSLGRAAAYGTLRSLSVHGLACVLLCRGYLNFGTLYIWWLCSAVFCHLPSFEALGLDMKADVSLGLSIAASSFLVRSFPGCLIRSCW